MSLYSSMNTSLSGMTAQSRALGHIADNVANSQTIGFKRTDTNFVSFLTESNADIHRPGTVIARPDFTNQLQGPIEQVENPLALAISGEGFFTTTLPIGSGDGGSINFDPRKFYTRAGDFSRNDSGYLVNGAGYVLQGWLVNDGVVDTTTTVPIQITEDVFTPTPTRDLEFIGNLTAGGAAAQSTSIQVIDSLGNVRVMTLTFTPSTPGDDNTWDLSIVAPDAETYTGAPVGTPAGTLGSLRLQFGQDPADDTLDQPDGLLANFINPVGNLSGSAVGTGLPALVSFTADFGTGPQAFSLDLGSFGAAGGLTQFYRPGGTGLSVNSFSQDGIPLGSFSSVTTDKNGNIRINYDNGQQRVVARVPLTLFKDPDKLEHVDGQAFLPSYDSGTTRVVEPGVDGAGLLTTRAVERSNVDIASEFTKLILAQRAYSANTKIVTTVDELLQETLNMRR